MRIGYACLNTTLAEQKIMANRSMVQKTFLERGLAYASELALKNIIDLGKIIDWNLRRGITLYRMSSDMFPWMSEYEIEDLPAFETISDILKRIGDKVKDGDLRLTFHPGPFNVLASGNERIVKKTVKELRQHGEIMDMLGLPRTPFAKINLHIGGAYGDRPSALKRFIDNFSLLPSNVRARLTVENDDKANMYSVTDLTAVHEATGAPVVFDYHHHSFRSGDLTPEEAMILAYETWPHGITPVVHLSSSRKTFEDPGAPETSHADFVYEGINTFGLDVDIMLEAKAKEKAALLFITENKLLGQL